MAVFLSLAIGWRRREPTRSLLKGQEDIMSYEVRYKKDCPKRLAAFPAGRWDPNLAERYAKRAGKLARNG